MHIYIHIAIVYVKAKILTKKCEIKLIFMRGRKHSYYLQRASYRLSTMLGTSYKLSPFNNL